MKLSLKNIGKIENATVELNGITVIAGENNTGKSTVGKVLFCIFNSFYKIEDQIYRERKYNIDRLLNMIYRNVTNRLSRILDIEEMADSLLENSGTYVENENLLQQEIINFFIQYDENFEKNIEKAEIDVVTKRILELLQVSDEKIFKTVLFKKLDSEFNGQINNIYFPEDEGMIELTIKENNVIISITDNQLTNILNKFSLNTEVIYIDDPFALDEPKYTPLNMRSLIFRYSNYAYTNHREHLQLKLFNLKAYSSVKEAIGEIITTNKLDNILSKLNPICSGEMIRLRSTGFAYKKNGSDAVLDIKNISTGLKAFVILKTLLINGSLEQNGTIVLDEPEIHLHPEWQLIFAELIVLIQKEFNMHILVNTHSPYFLRAIEVYSAKYEIADKCKFYLSSNKGNKAILEDVTTYTEKIYKKLSKPLETLQIERYNND